MHKTEAIKIIAQKLQITEYEAGVIITKAETGKEFNDDHELEGWLNAYFNHLSIFKDKILKKGIELGAINQQEADYLLDTLPLFYPVPAYIAGFALKNTDYCPLSYTGKKGRKNYTIQSWNGEIKAGDLRTIHEQENLSVDGKVKFESIGNFSHENGYLFNVGNLRWKKQDWEEFVIKPM